jgi:hypothetical protein
VTGPRASAQTRERLVEALRADLVGPFDPALPDELLRMPPSRWYLTGFLAPTEGRELDDPTADEETDAGSDTDDEDSGKSEPAPKQKRRLPASMGMSVLLPPEGDAVKATVSYADYAPEPQETEDGKRRTLWRRVPRPPITVDVPLDPKKLERVSIPGADHIVLIGKLGAAEAPGLPPGTRALSLFVVNQRPTTDVDKRRQDERFIFQVSLELEAPVRFQPRPNNAGESSDEWDERVADLQFRNKFELAVGHNVAVAAQMDGDGHCRRVRTTWLPEQELRGVEPRKPEGVTVDMQALAELPDATAVRQALGALPAAYGAWIGEQRRLEVGRGARGETRDKLMDDADRARARIAAGIALLERDAEALHAFRLANRAMALAAGRQRPNTKPAWRLFQLAFLLLNLDGMSDDGHSDRACVELLFFPTGGGKTEAYLGLIAYTLVLRRLRGQARPDKGLGVTVLLRYTLRLLTLDQLGRAASLVCAMEMLRQQDPERLGGDRFAVGLWVGRSATANTMGEVAEKITEYKNSASKLAPSPFPLTNCPWCDEPLTRDSLTLAPNRTSPTQVVVACIRPSCDFSAARNRQGLPVLFVDEQIYRELPAFIVATVDKFAMLPWRGETGMLFGRVTGRDGRSFRGPLDGDAGTDRLPDGLRPPELIVQDELHLISGPLGTMVGLYESAIEALCERPAAGRGRILPKIIASTATARRAREQVRALFGRADTAMFPPPGPNDAETFFAAPDTSRPGRQYVGVAASGRAMKAIQIRTYVALLGAAERVYDPKGADDQPADGYMTLVGYFNSLRELGGMRRLVEDEVRHQCAAADRRRPENLAGPSPWFAPRKIQGEPVELTSREHTGRIKEAKARLAQWMTKPDHVDVVLASNMISVGIDIGRLGLMVVAGQPKTTSEYIQASSRVGRDPRWPGLVVTCFNLHKPRDRSHYERFCAYHETFYGFVEAQSLTPFSGPALERGLAGTLVAITRLVDRVMTPADAAMALPAHREIGTAAAALLAERAERQPGSDRDGRGKRRAEVQRFAVNLLDAWDRLGAKMREAGTALSYSPYDKSKAAGKPLLRLLLDEEKVDPGSDEAKFIAPTSMREVEATVHLWLERRNLGGRS